MGILTNRRLVLYNAHKLSSHGKVKESGQFSVRAWDVILGACDPYKEKDAN